MKKAIIILATVLAAVFLVSIPLAGCTADQQVTSTGSSSCGSRISAGSSAS